MLRLILEIVPHGKEEDKKKIGEMVIINDSTGDNIIGNYIYEIKDNNGTILHKGYYKGFLRIKGAWSLIQNIFKSMHNLSNK